MTAKVKHTVKLADGTTATRTTTGRIYEFAIVLERTPAEHKAELARIEGKLAEARALVAKLEPLAATPEARAAFEHAKKLTAYWHETVTDPRDPSRTEERWLALSPRAFDWTGQADIDAYYALLRPHGDYIPETYHFHANSHQGVAAHRAGIKSLPLRASILGLAPSWATYKAHRDRCAPGKVVFDAIDISSAVSDLLYGSVGHKLVQAREEVGHLEAALTRAQEHAVGAESQSVYGWAENRVNAQKRIEAERKTRPLARIFALEAERCESKPRAKK